jgi:UDP-glucose 4-epimerase
MIVVISGATGFLGSHLSCYLSSKYSVIAIVRKLSMVPLNDNIEFVDLENIDNITQKPSVIIMCHAAVASGNVTQNEQALHSSDIEFTSKILDKFPNTRCIYISSVSTFKQSTNPIDESFQTQPYTSYGQSKLKAEQLIFNNRRNACVIRFSSLYGSEMKQHTLIANYVNQALIKKCIEVWGDGHRKQNYIHVQDAVKLIEKAVEQKEFNRDIFLGTFTKEFSNREVAETIQEITGCKIIYVNKDDSPSVAYNNTITRKRFNWESEIDFKEGIFAYIQWRKKQF